MRPFRNTVLALALALALASIPEAAPRCDLVARRCLDFTNRGGAALTVPAATTRIPHDGLVLCSVPGSAPAPTDIVYIVDQSTSMKPAAIQVAGKDTTGWFQCDRDLACTGSIPFHGARVCQIPSTTSAAAIADAGCMEAGDTYGARAEAVYASIASQARRAPGSHAATVNFNRGVSSTQVSTTRLDAAGVASLLTTVPLAVGSSTNYEAPLEWARLLLHGGQNSRGTKVTGSPNAKKAIFLISDGQPNQGDWRRALEGTEAVSMTADMFPGVANANSYAGMWTGNEGAMPPVYGIFLGNDASSADTLKEISRRTGGTFHLIPPNQPDSLGRVIEGILGALIGAAIPTTFAVTNLSNGSASAATTPVFDAAAGGYRVVLDSLLPLDTGANMLLLKTRASVDGVVTTLVDTIDVSVSGAGTSTRGTRGLDTVLAARCQDGSSLRLSPDVSGLAFAEAGRGDTRILSSLSTIPDNCTTLPLSFETVRSADREALSVAVPASAVDSVPGTFAGGLPWGLSVAGAVPGDATVRSGYGWDTVVARFRMPRDRRDTASARLALHRSGSPSIEMTNSVIGPEGRIEVEVVDSAATAGSVQVHLRGLDGLDTLVLTLARAADHVYKAGFSFVQGGAPDVRDAVLQLAPSDGSPHVVSGVYVSVDGSVEARSTVASDALPTGATIVDTDADGRADRVFVRLRAPLKTTDSVGFTWPDTAGATLTRILPIEAGSPRDGGATLVFDLPEPFAFAATACPPRGCEGLGFLVSGRGAGTARFPIDDGVDPLPTSARFGFAALFGGRDTLIARFSERVEPSGTGAWVAVGRPGQDSLGTGVIPLEPAWLGLDRRTAYFLLDSTFAGTKGDSLRISAAPGGALSDTAGNAPERLAWWTPIVWGAPPALLDLEVPHPVLELEKSAPADVSRVTRYVRQTADASWKPVDGGHPDPTHRSGVVVTLNRIPTNLALFIYDNMGVSVLTQEFSDLAKLADQGLLSRTRRGDYEMWLAWDGRDDRGLPVATGVYFVRMHARIHGESGERILLNAVRKVGIHRTVPR